MPEDFGIVSEGITAPLKTVTETNIEFSVAEPGIQTTAVTLKLKQTHHSEQRDKNHFLLLNNASQTETHLNYCSRDLECQHLVTKHLKAMYR